jgi:hypothetical protein
MSRSQSLNTAFLVVGTETLSEPLRCRTPTDDAVCLSVALTQGRPPSCSALGTDHVHPCPPSTTKVIQATARKRRRGTAATSSYRDGLHLVRHVSDRIGVMYLGRMVEVGPAQQVFRHPAHP